MADPKHDNLERLFTSALAKDSWEARSAFLEGACGEDSQLRSQVEDLLRAHDSASSFLETPPVDLDATVDSSPPRENDGTWIGRYRLMEEIGEGGFGTVHLAEQEHPVRRKVALKIIKPGMDTRQVIARFEAERQALALMDHMNIARVLDAGTTSSGRPFFVMELVRGLAITAYCDNNRLTTRQRLELFIPMCHAVQHAHQKGIIHRDLKPTNVLVTLHDGVAVPKIIDFGIAKAISQRLTDRTLFTESRQFLGTPEYMSPDQAEMGGLDIDTRTDIYSLGVLLYELLTGTTPFEASKLRQKSYDDIRRTIREVEPPPPSTRLQTLSSTKEGQAVARHHQAEPAALARMIRKDMDWIVMKALEKDRTRRYDTAAALAEDIQRHLRHEPVEAGPPAMFYKVGKFVRRHRLGVLASSLVALALVVGLSLAIAGFIQAEQARVALVEERNVAEAARASAEAHRAAAERSAVTARTAASRSATMNEFLQEMLSSVDPSNALGREVSVRFILDEAARQIEGGALAEEPEVEAAVRMTLGETYEALGRYEAAEAHVRSARGVRNELLGEEDPQTLRSNRVLAGILRIQGKFTEAESLLRQTGRVQREVLGEGHRDTLATMNELALALMGPGRLDEAEVIHRRTLEMRRKTLGEEHLETLESLCHLGAVYRSLRREQQAAALLQEALSKCRRILGEEHPLTTTAMSNLGLFFEDRGDYGDAEELYRRTYELERATLGTDHPQVLITMNNLLRVLRVQDKQDELPPLIAERLECLRRAAEREDASPSDLHALAWELLNCDVAALRDAEAALPYVSRAVELDGARDANMMDTLAQACVLTGDIEGAIDMQRRAITRARAGGPYNRTDLEARLVDYLLQKGDVVAAAAVSWPRLTERLNESVTVDAGPGTAMVLQAEELMEQGQYGEAAALLRGGLAMRQKSLPEGHWLISETVSQLGEAVGAEGRCEEAESLLVEGYEAMHQDRRAPADRQARAIKRLITLYEACEQPERAAEWRQRLAEAIPSAAPKG